MGEKDVCLLALAGVSPVCLPNEAIGLIPDLKEWTEARAGSSAGCHSTTSTYQKSRAGVFANLPALDPDVHVQGNSFGVIFHLKDVRQWGWGSPRS